MLEPIQRWFVSTVRGGVWRVLPTGARRTRWTAGALGALSITLVSAAAVLAATPGTWTFTSSMSTGRELHTATLLSDGTVLVAGGGTATAELFDPVTSTWHLTASMTRSRSAHTATLLPDGKVLAAGTFDIPNAASMASAELYDPVRRLWTPTGSMTTGRDLHSATLLPDGKVLVAGGSDFIDNPLASAELYDPATGTWTPTGSTSARAAVSDAVLLPNGTVFGTEFIDTGGIAELYDPTSGSWRRAAAPKVPIGNAPAVTLLSNGLVLVASGGISSGTVLSAQLYDPAHDSWALTGSVHTGRELRDPVLLPNGTVLVAGGFGSNTAPTLASAELYDPTSGTWTETGPLRTGRQGHTLTLLPLGTVLAAGGFTCGPVCVFGPTLATAELYTPPNGTHLQPTCVLSATGTDKLGKAFIKVAARDIASGLKSIQVLQATNAAVSLPKFPSGFRNPGVVTATKIDASQPSTLKLSVTNRAGTTITCDPVLATLLDQRGGESHQVFTDIPRAESRIQLSNSTPGLDRVDIDVNGRRFRLADLADGETRTLTVSSAMHPGDHNVIETSTHGPRDGSALLVISD
jgi:hypothetical protein